MNECVGLGVRAAGQAGSSVRVRDGTFVSARGARRDTPVWVRTFVFLLPMRPKNHEKYPMARRLRSAAMPPSALDTPLRDARRVCVRRIRDSRVGRCVRRALEVADVDATVGLRAQLRRAARRVAVDGEPARHGSAPGQQISGRSHQSTAPCLRALADVVDSRSLEGAPPAGRARRRGRTDEAAIHAPRAPHRDPRHRLVARVCGRDPRVRCAPRPLASAPRSLKISQF